jgi:hypothetical protein
MNWREYIRAPEGLKGLKGFNSEGPGTDKTLKALKTSQVKSQDPESATTTEMCKMIDQVHSEINSHGHPWAGWWESLTLDQFHRIKNLELAIDNACQAHNAEGLTEALRAYREAYYSILDQQRRDAQ